MNREINVALIYGSVREGRFCDTVAKWAIGEIDRRPEFALDIIDPRSLSLALGNADTASLQQRLQRADSFIVVTPEYNHSFPAALKHLIDSVSDEWNAKPVAFVSYGGVSGGLRAVEQLRLVFAELHAVSVRDTVSFANAGEQFDAAGHPVAADRARRSLTRLLSRLKWWAVALRDARKLAPYDEAIA